MTSFLPEMVVKKGNNPRSTWNPSVKREVVMYGASGEIRIKKDDIRKRKEKDKNPLDCRGRSTLGSGSKREEKKRGLGESRNTKTCELQCIKRHLNRQRAN